MSPKPMSCWRIRIHDGFCEYEYALKSRNEDISIHDLYELIRKQLKADPVEGKFIKPNKDPIPS